MRQKLLRSVRKLMVLTIAFVLAVAMVKPFSASAADDTAGTKIDKSGILQIYVYHQDQNSGDKFFIQSGSGFLISDSEEGSQYVITCDHVAELDDQTRKEVCDALGLKKLNIKIDVVVTRDITQSAKIIKASRVDDFAILKLDAPIYQKNAMKIRPEGADLTEDVYAMGFPADIMDLTDFKYFTEDQVTVSKGSVSLCEMSNNGVPYVQHSAVMTSGCSGGPLVDVNGYVVGLNTFVYTMDTGSYYYSLKISEVTNALDMLGINYQTPDGSSTSDSSDTANNDATTEEVVNVPSEETTEEITEETTEEVLLNTVALDNVISEATGYMASDYTEESYAELKTAIDAAKSVKNNSSATQTDVDQATSKLQNAIDNLEESSNTTLLIIIIVSAIVVIIIVVVIILIVKSSKKKNTPSKPIPSQGYTAMPAPTPSIPPVSNVQAHAMPVQPQMPKAPIPPQQPSSPMRPAGNSQYASSYMNEGAGETSVLGYGTGETTVLGGFNQEKATLTRIKTNEKVDITKQLFRVGKERSKVDYCVTNNNSVSRIHADIVYKNGQYFIIDNNSTNYTFVNGQMIPAKQEVAIANGDKIKFAEEEFTFTIG